MEIIGTAARQFVAKLSADEMKKLVGIDPTEIKVGRDIPIDKIWDMLDGVREARKKLLQSALRLQQASSLLLREDPLFEEVTRSETGTKI